VLLIETWMHGWLASLDNKLDKNACPTRWLCNIYLIN
jgi:hypothetical protein